MELFEGFVIGGLVVFILALWVGDKQEKDRQLTQEIHDRLREWTDED